MQQPHDGQTVQVFLHNLFKQQLALISLQAHNKCNSRMMYNS
jgi:hypothetical protein